MSKPPDTLEELGDSLDLLEKLKNDQDQIEGRFNPLYEQFSILKKYEVQIDEKVIVITVNGHSLQGFWSFWLIMNPSLLWAMLSNQLEDL